MSTVQQAGYRPRTWMATASVALGAVYAAVPTFSGLALLAVLLTGALVGVALFAAPYPHSCRRSRPTSRVLGWWLGWTLAVIVLEAFVLTAGDELRWPTFSAIQDPLTTANPIGRLAAGAAWTAAGLGLITLTRRYRGSGPTTRLGVATAVAVVGGLLLLLAAGVITDGPMLSSRDAPLSPAPGVDNTAIGLWPATAWLMIGLFLAVITGAMLIHSLGRSEDPPSAIPDLVAWLMAPWVGRVLVYASWLWCGWHFLAR